MTYTVRDSTLLLRKKFKKVSSSKGVFHVTSNRKYIYCRINSAVRRMFLHRLMKQMFSNDIPHTMSTNSRSNYKTCSFREFSHVYSLYFPSVWDHKAESYLYVE